MARPSVANPGPLVRTPRVSVVIVNYNSWDDVARLVASLAASPEVGSGLCEIVVIDNGSEGSAPESLREPGEGVRVIERGENGGFAVGVNAGWRAARGDWILVLNPDVVADPGFLGQVVNRLEALDRDPPGIVGFGLRNPEGTPQPSVGTFPSLFRTVREQLIPRSRRNYQPVWRTRAGPVDWVTGACLLINGPMMAATGGLDEEFFLYYEEVALCRTARNLGWRVEYDPTIEVVHLRPLQNRAVSPRMRVITRHSKLLYFRKHLPRRQFLGLSLVVAVEARARGLWARLRHRPEDQRCWKVVRGVERTLRSGGKLGGRAVLVLADSVVEPEASSIRVSTTPPLA